MAPVSAPKTTWVSMTPASAMPLPTVAATLRWNTKMATKLKKAANSTAWLGRSTPVETTVAIEFAASWKPFMKSNSRASTTQRAVCMGSMSWLRGGSGVLEDHALDELGNVFALVGDGFQQLVDGLELDDLAHIGLFAKELAHGGAHDAVGVAFELVDLFAGLERGGGGLGVADVVQQGDGVLDALGALDAQVGQALDFVGHATHVVQGHGLGGVLHQVGHVVHRVDQREDLLAVDRGDEGGVQQAVDFAVDAVGSGLGGVHVAVVFLAQARVVVVANQLSEGVGGRHDVVGVLVEQLKKIALTGQQLSKKHGEGLSLRPGGACPMDDRLHRNVGSVRASWHGARG